MGSQAALGKNTGKERDKGMEDGLGQEKAFLNAAYSDVTVSTPETPVALKMSNLSQYRTSEIKNQASPWVSAVFLFARGTMARYPDREGINHGHYTMQSVGER